MRVVVDARPLSHPQAGGFRSYVRSLVASLTEVSGVEVILYLDRPVAPESLPAAFSTRILAPSRLKTDFSLFAKQVRADAPDVVHGTVNYMPATPGFTQVLTLHDALGLKTYPWEAKVRRLPRGKGIQLYWKAMTLASARRARRLITASHGVARELSQVVGRPVSDFSIVYHSIRLPAPTPGIVRDARSVLAIASPDPRKNLACLYDALSQHKNVFGAMGPPQLDVVCTNADAARRAEGELMGRGIRDYRLLTQLSDQALADAYSAATAFAFPSLREGFGLPPVEAMSLGTPVVASNAEPMPEILGDAALLFSPDSPDELARQLALVLNHTAEQARLSTLGRERAGLYTPRAQGEGTLAAWKAAR